MTHLLEARGREPRSLQHQREHLTGLKRKLAEPEWLRAHLLDVFLVRKCEAELPKLRARLRQDEPYL